MYLVIFENGVPAVTSEVSETLMICSDHGNCDIYDITNSSAITCLNMDRVWVAVDPLPALAVDLLPAPEGGDK